MVLESWWENNDKGRKWKEDFYFEGCWMLRILEIGKFVVDEFDWIKGLGVVKLVCLVRENYVGLSCVRV